MKRRPVTHRNGKLTKKEYARRNARQQVLAAKVAEFVSANGGAAESRSGFDHTYTLPTKAGVLRLSVHTGIDGGGIQYCDQSLTVFMRFVDVEAAKKLLGSASWLNTYSGKWNFGPFDTDFGPFDAATAVDEFVESWKRHMKPVLLGT
jgi:hypothetical protein